MFSNLAKRLQDGLEAVESSMAAAATAGSSSIQRTASPDPTGRSKSPATGTRITLDTQSVPVARRGGSLDERLRAKLSASAVSPSSPLVPQEKSPKSPVQPPSRPDTPSQTRSRADSQDLTSNVVHVPSRPSTPSILDKPRVDLDPILRAARVNDPASVPLPTTPPVQPIELPVTPLPPPPVVSAIPALTPAEDDPLTPNLHTFDKPKTADVHARNNSGTSLKSTTPALQMHDPESQPSAAEVSPLTPEVPVPIPAEGSGGRNTESTIKQWADVCLLVDAEASQSELATSGVEVAVAEEQVQDAPFSAEPSATREISPAPIVSIPSAPDNPALTTEPSEPTGRAAVTESAALPFTAAESSTPSSALDSDAQKTAERLRVVEKRFAGL